VRAVFFLLLFANLAFLAWSQWIDVPQRVPANDVYAKLPRLKLIGEQPGDDNRPSSGSARKTALEAPPPPAPPAQCFSMGPFEDQDSATRGASLLRDKGLDPRQRTAQGEIAKGFWVYIGGLKTDGDVAQVLRTLEQSHVEDAHVMPDTGNVHQVSVGLFSDRDRADRRAESVQKLGLQPEVAERKLPATVFWMDVDLAAGAAAPAAQDFASAALSTPIQVIPCPGGPSPPNPAPTSPDGTTTTFTKVATGAPKVP
jgi:hypothetical protein